MRRFLQITYPRKRTVAFHDLALSLLPVVLTLLVSFSFEISLENLGIRNFWLIKCQRCKEENLSQRII